MALSTPRGLPPPKVVVPSSRKLQARAARRSNLRAPELWPSGGPALASPLPHRRVLPCSSQALTQSSSPNIQGRASLGKDAPKQSWPTDTQTEDVGTLIDLASPAPLIEF